MLKKTRQIELTRRVADYHAMFLLLAVAWLLVSAFYVVGSVFDARSESACLIQLGRAAATLSIEYVRDGPESLQRTAERIRAEGSLSYCAVVNTDSKIIAHSSEDLSGKVWTEPTASVDEWNGVRRVRFTDNHAGNIREYSMPLRNGHDVVGTVHIAVPEPSIARTAIVASQYSHVLLLGPLLLVVGGSYVLRGIVNPLNEIEIQLKDTARLPSSVQPELRPVAMQDLAGLGWNRLAEAWSRRLEAPSSAHPNTASDISQKQYLETVFQALPDGVAVTNLDNVLLFANPAMAALLRARGSAELLGQTMQALLEPHWRLEADHALVDKESSRRAIVSELQKQQRCLALRTADSSTTYPCRDVRLRLDGP